MISLTDNLWIGNSEDNAGALDVGGMLNVAQDLRSSNCGWPDIEYMQIGLIDGPGNPISAYHSAVLALITLLSRYNKVLIYCHTGGRSLAVSLIYFNLVFGRGWDAWLLQLQNKIGISLPIPHEAHRQAYNKMNWRLLSGN